MTCANRRRDGWTKGILGYCETIKLAFFFQCLIRRFFRRFLSSKDSLKIKSLLVFHNIVCSLAPFGSQGFRCQSAISFRFLPIIESLGLGAGPNGMVHDFDKRPCQVRIAILAVVRSFRFTIGYSLGSDATTIGGEIANLEKSRYVSGL